VVVIDQAAVGEIGEVGVGVAILQVDGPSGLISRLTSGEKTLTESGPALPGGE